MDYQAEPYQNGSNALEKYDPDHGSLAEVDDRFKEGYEAGVKSQAMLLKLKHMEGVKFQQAFLKKKYDEGFAAGIASQAPVLQQKYDQGIDSQAPLLSQRYNEGVKYGKESQKYKIRDSYSEGYTKAKEESRKEMEKEKFELEVEMLNWCRNILHGPDNGDTYREGYRGFVYRVFDECVEDRWKRLMGNYGV